jgi:hypothetical protein
MSQKITKRWTAKVQKVLHVCMNGFSCHRFQKSATVEDERKSLTGFESW